MLTPKAFRFSLGFFLAVWMVPVHGLAATSRTLTVSPSSFNFGSVQVGASSTRSETLTNSRRRNSVTVSTISISGTGFSISGVSLPVTLAPGKSLSFTVKFAPTKTGNASGNIALVYGSTSRSIPLSGSATGTTTTGSLSLTPSSVQFGNVTVGTSSSRTGTLAASGASITISSATTSNQEFSISGVALPLTIAAGQSKTLAFNFKPGNSGNASANLSLASNATNSTLVVAATGTGVAAPVHRVDLTWSPSSSSIAGYNVYRSTTSGSGYAKLNSSANVSTAFSDSGVNSGGTYFYVTTAVTTAGVESVRSNEVRVAVPTP